MIRSVDKVDSQRSFKVFWLALYLVINALATLIIVNKGELIGDITTPVSDFSIVYLAFVLVGFSYWFFLGPFFNFAAKFKVSALKLRQDHELVGNKIGLLLLVWQICFIIFNTVYGTSVAGAGNISSGSFLGYVFVLLDSDALFFIYYGIFRENKYFKYNLAVYVLSNVLRGWAGVFLFILFFESCRMYRARRLKIRVAAALLILTAIMYPTLSAVKWAIRANAFVGDSAIAVVTDTVESLDYDDYFNLVSVGTEHIVERLQSVSALVDIIKNQGGLSDDFASGKFLPFWLEGLHGTIIDRVLNGSLVAKTERMPVSVVYWDKLRPDSMSDGIGNVATSYPGWIVIAPLYSGFYILYTMFLGVLPLLLVKKMTREPAAREMVWLAWLMYLMVPWLGAMVKFVYSVFFFYLLYSFFGKSRIRFWGTNSRRRVDTDGGSATQLEDSDLRLAGKVPGSQNP